MMAQSWSWGSQVAAKKTSIKYTTGEAKNLIKHWIQQLPAEGYKNVMELLESRYGDLLKILASY